MFSLKTRSGNLADASLKGGRWRFALGRSAVSRSLPAWPLRDDPFFRTCRWERPGCLPPLVSCGVRAGSSVPAWTRTGRLRRLASLIPLFPSFQTPHRLSTMVDLVRATAAHRTLTGLIIKRLTLLPRVRKPGAGIHNPVGIDLAWSDGTHFPSFPMPGWNRTRTSWAPAEVPVEVASSLLSF